VDVVDWYRLFTWLALFAQAAWVGYMSLLVLGRVLPSWRPRADALHVVVRNDGLALAALVAVVASAGSLYLSEGGHLVPCRLCWFQRIAMYPLAVILTIAAVRKDWAIRPYALVLAIGGALVSTWHYLVEWFPSLEGVGGKCDPTNPCSALPLSRRYGYISIPLMAGTAFVCIATVLLAGGPNQRNSP
jgi:disulfide bond formation protein DsbB